MSEVERDYENAADLPEMQEAFASIEKELNGDLQEVVDQTQEDQGETESEIEDSSKENREENSEPSQEEEPEEESPYVASSKKLRHYRKEKNDLIAQREYLREENEKLKEALKNQEYKTRYSEGEHLYGQLDQAISLKKAALEEGDVDSIVKADINLIKAQNKVAELEVWIEKEKARLDQEKEEPANSEEAMGEQVVRQLSQEWLKENPDLNPRSIYYNPDKADQVKGFIDYLDRYLVEENLQHLYFSPEYFERIEDFKQNLSTSQKKTGYSSVAPVRNSAAPPSKAPRQTITLTQQEKVMAQNMGITPEEWLKYKIEQYREEGRSHA